MASKSPQLNSSDPLLLDNQLCFALHAAARAIARTYREKLDPIGLTHTQYLAMLTLWERDNRTVSEIGDALMLDSGTLSPLIKKLESRGLVRRVRSKDDQRVVRIAVTKKGLTLRADSLAARTHVVHRLKMSDAEIAELRQSLQALTSCLSEKAYISPAQALSP